MGLVRTLVACVAGLALSNAMAAAADMPGYPLPPPSGPPVVVSANQGWYLRGDLGYAWSVKSDPEAAAPFPSPVDSDFGNGYSAGLGVGYKSRWLRTDLTVDYLSPRDYTGTAVTTGDTTAKIQSTAVLLNGYLDLGTWYRVTPYIGGGVGVAHVRAYDYVSTGAPPFTGDTARSQWNFAWAGMAGFAIAVAPNIAIDVGYRYLNVGDAATGSDAFGAMTFKNIATQEVRVGVRWSFDDIYVGR